MSNNHWTIVNLGDIAAKEPNAIVDGPFGSNLKLSDYVDDGIPVLQGKNITGNEYSWFDIRYITKKKARSLQRSLVRVGDILIIKIGSIGYSARITDLKDYPYALIPANLCKVTPNLEIIDPDYLVFYLQSKPSVNYLRSNASATSQPALSLGKIKKLPIPLPPLIEQRQIANILRKADRLRQLRQYARQLGETISQSLFVEIFGDPFNNPKKFATLPLSNLLATAPQNGLYLPSEQYEPIGSTQGIEMVHMADAFYGKVERGELRRVNVNKSVIKKYALHEADLLIARRSLTFEGAAKPCLIPVSNEPLVFESSLIRITPDIKKVLPLYLYYYLSNGDAKKAHVLKYITRSTISGISQDNLIHIKIIVPPINEQEFFIHLVDKYENLHARQREAERQSEELFQALLQKSFGGEL